MQLSLKQQEKVENTIDIFQKNPHDRKLINHALHDKDQGKRSISVSGDLRLVFEEENNYFRVIFIHRKGFTKGIEKLTQNQKKRVGTAHHLYPQCIHQDWLLYKQYSTYFLH